MVFGVRYSRFGIRGSGGIRRRGGSYPLKADEPPGLRSKQSPDRTIQPGALFVLLPPSEPGWICLRQIAFVPNAGTLPPCGVRASPTGEERRHPPAPVGAASGRLQTAETAPHAHPAVGAALIRKDEPPGLRSKQSYASADDPAGCVVHADSVVRTRLDLPCGKLRSCRTPGRSPLAG